MKRILYYSPRPVQRKGALPYNVVYTSKIKDVYTTEAWLIIFPETILTDKRQKIDFARLQEKVCFVCFSGQIPADVDKIKDLGFFDYIREGEGGKEVFLKVKRAEDFWALKRKLNYIERELAEKSKQIKDVLFFDPLSKCYNWRYFIQQAEQEFNRVRSHFYNLAFIAIDIDYFHQINEIYSSHVGDEVIKTMGTLLKKYLRKEDILARWRDDEFFIILPYLSKKDVNQIALRLKDSISLYKFCYKKLTLTVTTSIGVVSFPEDPISNSRDVITALEECILTAKRSGGNTIITYPPTRPLIKEIQGKGVEDIDKLKHKIDRLNNMLTRDLLEMIYGFARAIEAKDHYTGKHVEDTATLAEKIARELRLPPADIETVKRASVLHDLGKVGIDDNILSKQGPLTKKERMAVEKHPVIATEILREIHALRSTIPAILYHHERYDGNGYPLGLVGEEIPLHARIVAIADVYQALISDRPYRKALSKKEACEIIKKSTGTYFDPKIVRIFLKVIGGEK